MRSTHIRRSVLLGAVLLGATSAASADDDLFSPSYQRMGLVPGSAGPAPAPPMLAPPPPAPATTPPVPAAPVVQPAAPAGRPRLTTWPSQALNRPQHQHQVQPPQAAPVAPAPLRARLSRRGPAPVEPVTLPAPTPTPGPTVAATLSVPANDAPTTVPTLTRGMLARLRKAEPLVPPGRPRGSQPVEMVPPGPLGPDPMMAELAGSAARRSAELDRVEAPSALAPQPMLAARPEVSETSPFAPVSAHDRLGAYDRAAEVAARHSSRPIPPLIARPTGPEADSPLRRVQASEADLEPQAAPILNGPND